MSAVAAENLSDGGANAAGGTGDNSDLAVKRALPIRCVSLRVVDMEDLRINVGRLAGKNESQRGLKTG